jgi:hypothetical protein
MKGERLQAWRDLLEWKIFAVALIAAWLTVTFTKVAKQIPLPGLVTAVAIAIIYWEFFRSLVWFYFTYRARIAYLAAKRAAAQKPTPITESGKED